MAKKDDRTLGQLVDETIHAHSEAARISGEVIEAQHRLIEILYDPYVVVTRFTPRRGGARKVVRHVYGLFSEAEARTERNRLLAGPLPGEGSMEVSTHKLIDVKAREANNRKLVEDSLIPATVARKGKQS